MFNASKQAFNVRRIKIVSKMYVSAIFARWIVIWGLVWLIALVWSCQLNIYLMCLFVLISLVVWTFKLIQVLRQNRYDLISILMTYPILRRSMHSHTKHTLIYKTPVAAATTAATAKSAAAAADLCVATRVKKCVERPRLYFSSVSCFSCHNK